VSTFNPAIASGSTGNWASNKVRDGGHVQAAIRDASQRTDVDFDYLMAQARIESALNPSAKARTSSAAGLYQFTNQTWLETLDRHGEKHGFGWAAQAISSHSGRARITDPAMANAIMQLRYDPDAASLMAGELANDNAAFLQNSFGRPADHTELYLAHFLGAGGARKFIAAHEANPGQSAAALFPQAAAANRGVFYSGGQPRSIGEVRELFAGKLERFGSQAMPFANPAAFAEGSATSSRAASQGSSWTSSSAPQSAYPTSGPPRRSSMSEILESTFAVNSTDASSQSGHVNRAYKTIARFGL